MATAQVFTTACDHSFHTQCLSQWADSPCPVCRYHHYAAGEIAHKTAFSFHENTRETQSSRVLVSLSLSLSNIGVLHASLFSLARGDEASERERERAFLKIASFPFERGTPLAGDGV